MIMKPIILLVLCFVFFHPAFAQQDSTTSLPEAAKNILTEKHSDWDYSPSYQDAVLVLRQYDKINWPWLFKGDFNGDQQTDYVVIITFTENEEPKTGIVALLQTKDNFEYYWITYADQIEQLWVYKKDDKIRKENYFGEGAAPVLWEFKNDAISHGYDGKPYSAIYIFQNGAFISLHEVMDN